MLCAACGRSIPDDDVSCAACGAVMSKPNSADRRSTDQTTASFDPPAFDGTFGALSGAISRAIPTGTPSTGGPLTPGQAFGSRYHIQSLLGSGGMGAVYQAWDAELNVLVALKVILPS